MLIRLKKTRDGVVLSCIRAGGTAAVQRTGHAGFFALHDLMHYAVETTLGFRNAFFGLMAQGWDFGTFGDRNDPRYRAIPDEAITAEHLVAILTREIRSGVWTDSELVAVWTDEINAELAAALGRAGRPVFRVDRAQVHAICLCFVGLVDRWAGVATGAHLELGFTDPAAEARGVAAGPSGSVGGALPSRPAPSPGSPPGS